MVIFGATGDLTKRLVVPALYNLSRTKVLPEQFALIGVALAEGTSEGWRDELHGMLKALSTTPRDSMPNRSTRRAWRRLAERMSMSRAT